MTSWTDCEDEPADDETRPDSAQTGPKPPIIAVFNHKGGIAKTTTACNLAACWAAEGHRVLLIDMDAQGNAGASFGLTRMPDIGVWDVMTDQLQLAQASQPSRYPGLTLLPASHGLRNAELVLGRMDGGIDLLRTHLADIDADVVLIDCPPSFGLTALNALSAATAVVIPSRPDPFSHEGMVSTWVEISRLRRMPMIRLAQVSMLLTMVDQAPAPTQAQAHWTATARTEFGPLVCTDTIPMDSDVMTAAGLYMPTAVLSPDGLAASAYLRIARELANRFSLWQAAAVDDDALARETVNTLRQWRADHPELTAMGIGVNGWVGVEPKPPDAPMLPARAKRLWLVALSGIVILALTALIWLSSDALLATK